MAAAGRNELAMGEERGALATCKQIASSYTHNSKICRVQRYTVRYSGMLSLRHIGVGAGQRIAI